MHGMKCQSDCAAMGDGPYCKFFMYCMKFQLDHAAMCNDLTYEKLNRGQCLIPQADCIEPQSKEWTSTSIFLKLTAQLVLLFLHVLAEHHSHLQEATHVQDKMYL